MPDRSPESIMRMSQFKAGLALLRGSIDTATEESEVEFMFRELDQMSAILIPKFRKGNALSQMLYKNRLRPK